MNTRKTIILLISLISFYSGAQETYLSLDSLLSRVETNFPSILQYQQNIQAIQSKAEGSNFWMAPTISTGFSRFPYNFSMLNEKNDPMNQAGIMLSFEQMIPNPVKINSRYNYIQSLSDIEKAKQEWTKNELRKETKVLFYYRYKNEKKKILLNESREILTMLISTAEEKFSNNQSQLQTIFKAKARLTEIDNMILMLDSQIAESNIGLNSLLLRDVNTNFQIDTSKIILKDYSRFLADTGKISLRSDITSIDQYIESMKLEQKYMRSGLRPDFGLRVEHMQMFGMPNQWSVMGMMTIPLAPWSSRMINSESKSLDFQIESMRNETQTMKLMAMRMASEKLSMLKYENAQYNNYISDIIPAYDNNLQINILAYKQNTGDFFILLDAWEMLLMKKIEAIEKMFTLLKLEAEYEYEMEIR